MNVVYSAKYNDVLDIPNPFASKHKVSVRGLIMNVMKYVTGLFLIGWLVGVIIFMIYPLLPRIRDMRSSIDQFSAYDIGYSATTQLFVKISPPSYSIPDHVDGDGALSARTVEYVDPDEVDLADVESKGTTISLPSAYIEGKVVDGYSQEEMLRGFWHYPASSIPGERGNTVIFGHRFHKIPPNKDTFFNLDDASVGDAVVVQYGETDISYTVVATKIVDKTDTSILRQTGDYRLTLVTCTPLWTAEKRLVVIAIQDEISSVV